MIGQTDRSVTSTRRAYSKAITVKICGLMQPEHAAFAARHGADMIGVVFAKSRRQLSPDAAAHIRAAIDAPGLETRPLLVGVFVNEPIPSLMSIARHARLDILQLSGDESPEYVALCALHYPIIKAVRFPSTCAPQQALDTLDLYESALDPDSQRVRFLIDAYQSGEYGGTGRPADWPLAATLAAHREIILAGGLTPRNVQAAITSISPWGVDVSSGVETAGAKDPILMQHFLAAALSPISTQ